MRNQICLLYILSCLILFEGCQKEKAEIKHHLWEKIEIEFEAQNDYANPYTDVEIWVDLKGPEFDKRCYGFWDGENNWKVRIMATTPGVWTWESGSNQKDEGLNQKKETFEAIEWTEAEKLENSLRRGLVKADEEGHSFEYADGTPMFWLADTWWPCMTNKYFWHEDDSVRKVGTPGAGFKDYVQFRKEQGFNGCMVIAAFPNWLDENDGWRVKGNWADEYGNWSFEVMDNQPDLDRINPAYFQTMDKKVDYLNANGFIPFIEISRRDIAELWKNNYQWPDSYAQYIRYIYFRYQGNIIFNSPVHLDNWRFGLTKEDWNQAANSLVDDYGWPVFGHMSSANPPGDTYHAFGHTDEARWLSFHGVGNKSRDHYLFTTIPEMFSLEDPVPIVNNEPYYDGLKWGNDADLGSDLAAYFSRVALYGSVLSGAMAGHVYGAHHIWRGDEHTSQAFLSQAAAQMHLINGFLFSEGNTYRNLIPAKHLLRPYQTTNEDDNMGWAYCMRTENKDLFLLYFEKACQKPLLTETQRDVEYEFNWYDPETGEWVKKEKLSANIRGFLQFPDFPGGKSTSGKDWAVKVKISSSD